MKYFKVLLVSLLLLTVGCNASPDPLVSPLSESGGNTQNTMTSPMSLPTPNSEDYQGENGAPSDDELVPDANTGIVTGKLDRVEHEDGLPSAEWNLYLGRIVHAENNEEFEVARMEPSQDPFAHFSLEKPWFVFRDVPPNEYALYTVTPRGESILLMNLDTGKEIVVEVQAGEVIKLDTLPVDFGF
jgi:hypothetical protein